MMVLVVRGTRRALREAHESRGSGSHAPMATPKAKMERVSEKNSGPYAFLRSGAKGPV